MQLAILSAIVSQAMLVVIHLFKFISPVSLVIASVVLWITAWVVGRKQTITEMNKLWVVPLASVVIATLGTGGIGILIGLIQVAGLAGGARW